MRRRKFLGALSGAMAWPLGVAAQTAARSGQGASPHVRFGYIWIGAEGSDGETLRGIRQGLADVGLVDGRNMTFEARYAEGRPERLQGLVEDLLRLDVAIFIIPGAVVTRAVAEINKTIPIVSVSADPVGAGFAQACRDRAVT